MDELVLVKSSYQKNLRPANIKLVKPFNVKVGQRDATKIYSHRPLYFEIQPKQQQNIKIFNKSKTIE